MTFIGLIVFYFLAVLGKAAKGLNIGPRWLRRFEIEKNTFY